MCMKELFSHARLYFFTVLICILGSICSAEVSISGSVSPGDISLWDEENPLFVGYLADGRVDVDDGTIIIVPEIYCGYNLGALGTLNLSDPQTILLANVSYLGYSGSAEMNISNEAEFFSTEELVLGFLEGSQGHIQLTDPGSFLYLHDATIGKQGEGSINASNGAVILHTWPGYVYLGKEFTASGTLKLSGMGTKWLGASSSLKLGEAGTGSVLVDNGAELKAASVSILNEGQVVVSGENSVIKTTSFNGVINSKADLQVVNNGSLRANSLNFYGNSLISGQGSIMTGLEDLPGATFTGGTLEISEGAKAEFADCRLGDDDNDITANIHGIGSRLICEKDLRIGDDGSSDLNIFDGGSVVCQDARFSSGSSGFCRLDITGAGSEFSCLRDITLLGWNNQILVKDGGKLNCEYLYNWNDVANSYIKIDGANSIFSMDHLYCDDGTSTEIVLSNSGSMQISGYSEIDDSNTAATSVDFKIFKAGNLLLSSNIEVDREYQDSLLDYHIQLSKGGLIAFGFDFNGSLDNFCSSFGEPEIQIWSETQQQWLLFEDAVENEDYIFEFVTVGPFAGYTVLVAEPLECDLDFDGDVDVFDFLILKSNYGSTEDISRSMGDINEDGSINIFDFLLLKSSFGSGY